MDTPDRPFQISSSLIICLLGFIERRAHAEKNS
jgi:hypothetical protein